MYIAAQISGGVVGALVGGVAWSFVCGRFLTPRPVDVEAAGTQADRLETPTPGGDPHHHGRDEDEGGRAPRP